MNAERSVERSIWTETMMKFIADHDLYGEIYWSPDLKFWVMCSDTFYWGTADGEDVLEEDLPALKQALDDAGDIYGCLLYCARKREMRPQGAMYKHLPEKLHHLFDACGPVREAKLGNPVARS